MSDQTNYILNETSENEKFIEAHTLHSENFKKNIQRNEKLRQRNIDGNKNSMIQQNDEIFFNQQFRNAKMTMLRFHNP